MDAKLKINVVTSNHPLVSSIEDYISILRDISKKRGINFIASQNFQKGHLNLVIDEFSDPSFLTKISLFKQYYPTEKIILVATEFVETFHGVTSINIFNRISNIAIISYANVWIRFYFPDLKNHLLPGDILRLFIFIPLLPFVMIGFFMEFFRSQFKKRNSHVHQTLYHHIRYLGLKKAISSFDYVVALHENILYNMKDHFPGIASRGVFYPELYDLNVEDLFSKKVMKIDVSGTITSYRRSEMKRMQKLLFRFGGHFLGFNIIPFNKENGTGENNNRSDDEKSAFSFHPPQSSNWKYCSPTRLFRALTVDKNIPLLSKHFQQHPIEDCCIEVKTIEDLNKAKLIHERVEPLYTEYLEKLKNYSTISKDCNNEFINNIRELD
jgi:hypothetical protein